MTSPQDRLDDLDAMLAIAKARDFRDWDLDVVAYLTNQRLKWFRVFHGDDAARVEHYRALAEEAADLRTTGHDETAA